MHETQKIGSLQGFITGTDLLECMAQGFKRENIPAAEIHKTLAFDMLVGNADREISNFFLNTERNKLSLIDQGDCFPDGLVLEENGELTCYFYSCLTFFPQTKEPANDEIINYITKMNIDLFIQTIRNDDLLSETSITEFKIRHECLKTALSIQPPLSMYQISTLFDTRFKPCQLEKICREVKAEMSGSEVPEGVYFELVASKIRLSFQNSEFIKDIRSKQHPLG